MYVLLPLYFWINYLAIFFLFLWEKVGYKVRLEGMKGRDTRLLFCTTGILLRRLLVDRKLKGVTHVIVDEIHERGMNEGNQSIVICFLFLWISFILDVCCF